MAWWRLCEELLRIVFPYLDAVLVERVGVVDGVVRIAARSRAGTSIPCPDCGYPAHRVHSRYRRHLDDLAVGERPVVVDLSVRRLFRDCSPEAGRISAIGRELGPARHTAGRHARCESLHDLTDLTDRAIRTTRPDDYKPYLIQR